MNTLLLPPSAGNIFTASRILTQGGLVAFPTETVYGLGADALNPQAVTKVFEVKGRPASNPLIVHIKDINMASELAHFDEVSYELAEHFWPGPLTLILPLREHSKIAENITANSGYVALRVPQNQTFIELIESFGRPIVGPSANLSGKISSTTALHVLSDFDGKIDAILEGDDCLMGLESTILMYDDPKLQILRLGYITKDEISTKIQNLVIEASLEGDKIPTPGSKFRHYSPDAPLRINCNEKSNKEVLIGFGESKGAEVNLSISGDLDEAAKNLYNLLRTADNMVKNQDYSGIAVSPVPNIGLGLSINDRLERAAGKI